MFRRKLRLAALLTASLMLPSASFSAEQAKQKRSTQLPSSYCVSESDTNNVLSKVDKAVRKYLYSKKLSTQDWPRALERSKDAIVKSKNLKELSSGMNKAISELHSSHCQFVTLNDETYYFLHSLFSSFNPKLGIGKADFIGFEAGGLSFAANQVRFVLDDSPASKAGLKIGDTIISIDGSPFVGHANFLTSSGTVKKLIVDRNGERITLCIKPEKKDYYDQYIHSMEKSARILERDGKKIGYVHVWCGGGRSHEALDAILENKLSETDGIILDLRDGYGGNGLEDLDRFYRPKGGYPIFETVDRDGKKSRFLYYYEKPLVAIINGGSRSGKELLAFSLKSTGRARLVGTRTAGAVLGGRLVPIDKRSSLYVAVFDGTVGGVRLEGNGVEPDVEVKNDTMSQDGYEKQLDKATEQMLKLL